MSETPAHAAPSEPPTLSLWRTLRNYIEACFSLFGAPAALAATPFLTRARHAIATGWIAMLEHLLRRLLYLDAVALAPSPPSARKSCARRTRPAHAAAFDPANPESWRASFILSPRAGAQAGQAGGAAPAYLPSAPLARRFEALIRAFNAPERHVQRFADYLRRIGKAAFSVARKMMCTPVTRCPSGLDELRELAWRCSGAGPPRFADSS